MTSRPILFSIPMVREILDERKTMTRRVVKLPVNMLPNPSLFLIDPGGTIFGPGPYIKTWRSEDGEDIMNERIRCPYGYPGDRLWVRETWRPLWDDIDVPGGLGDCVQYRADMAKRKPPLNISEDEGYRFDDMCVAGCTDPKWKPSIHMPRWASRITLEVVSVKVERVADISPADCRKEGVGICLNDIGARYAFGQLWNQINEKRGYGWYVNPWVWVIEFRRVKQ